MMAVHSACNCIVVEKSTNQVENIALRMVAPRVLEYFQVECFEVATSSLNSEVVSSTDPIEASTVFLTICKTKMSIFRGTRMWMHWAMPQGRLGLIRL